jgi:peptidoglycan/LPS O-acetylase OafA/YrhL
VKRELSAYLDLLRILAAFAVFVSHLSWHQLTGGFLWQIQFLGHPAVVVFFVLSGFVIQYAASTKETTIESYTVARFARLYSVVLPALALTFACDTFGMNHNASVYIPDRETIPLERLTAAALFLSQSWKLNLTLLSNDAFWSLPYEFWYYQIFATATFFVGKTRVALIIGVMLITGPAILLLLPVWLLGVAAYRVSVKIKIGKIGGAVLWFGGVAGIIASVALRNAGVFHVYADVDFLPPGFSLTDYLLGVSVAGNIVGAACLDLPLARFAKPLSAVAGITFALYLFHLPLLHLAAAYIPTHWPVSARGIAAALFTLGVVLALSFLTERRKRRKREWRMVFRWLYARVFPVNSMK